MKIVRQFGLDGWWVARVLVGALIGLSLATMITSDPVSLPVLGSTYGAAVGAVGLVVGGALYTQLPDCNCGGTDCDCEDCGC